MGCSRLPACSLQFIACRRPFLFLFADASRLLSHPNIFSTHIFSCCLSLVVYSLHAIRTLSIQSSKAAHLKWHAAQCRITFRPICSLCSVCLSSPPCDPEAIALLTTSSATAISGKFILAVNPPGSRKMLPLHLLTVATPGRPRKPPLV